MKVYRLDQTPEERTWRFETLFKRPELGNDVWWCGCVEDGIVEVLNQEVVKLIKSYNPYSEIMELYKVKLNEGYTKSGSDEIKKIVPMKAAMMKKLPQLPFLVQPKIEGIRMLCYLENNDKVVQYSAQGTIYNIPHLQEIRDLFLYLPTGAILDGELYKHEMAFTDISSTVKNSSKSKKDLEYWVFDFYSSEKYPYHVRAEILGNAFDKVEIKDCRFMETQIVEDEPTFKNYYASYLILGYEGIILRLPYAEYTPGRNNCTLKLKQYQDFEMEVVEIKGNQLLCKRWNDTVVIKNNLIDEDSKRENEVEIKVDDVITVRLVEGVLKVVAVRDYE